MTHARPDSARPRLRDEPAPTRPPCSRTPLFQVKRVVVGQDRLVERVMVCLLAGGHVLIEGFPGLAKTLTVSTMARVIGGSMTRIQFTPDLVPADLVGTRIWRPSTEDFDIEWGPVFANLVLADEINRAPAKVQSALLEAMQERQVSIGGHTRALPQPFVVLATQNPIESEGVYNLPEAQRDRFLMHVVVPHPTYEEETAIATRMSSDGAAGRAGAHHRAAARAAAPRRRTSSSTTRCRTTPCASSWPRATRPRWGFEHLTATIALGASPRGTLGLISAARAPRRAARPPLRRAAGRVRRRTRGAAPPHHAHLRRARRGRRTRRRAARDPLDGPGAADRAGDRRRRRASTPWSCRRRRTRPRDEPRGRGRPSVPVADVAARSDVLRRLELERAPPDRRRRERRPRDHVGRTGQRARGRPRLRPGRRRAAHRLEPHRPLGRDVRPPDRGRPRVRDVDRRRPLGQPRLRHGPLREARRRPRAPWPGSACSGSAAATASAS